ncbi:type-2 ice-structuring protein-like isoform X2 [Toxotes jaculatrix]|uniref:type-2 ice-structuring protein-like isoform X2 n=1 Tax=Toxotes jaculatrix TaxID=941984 RepID=UPI001B3A8F22|nr:type-2 ice-structuring protein-like isoform X2 [Toxotes jaculatrix]
MLTATLLVCAMMALTGANDPSINSTSLIINRDESCPSNWKKFNDRCFNFVPRSLSWATAEKNCQSMDANLASVHSIEEYHFIQSVIQDNTAQDQETWVGASDCQEENVWLWSDGSVFKFSNWCQGQPDDTENRQRCLQINYGDGKCWDDNGCSNLRPSICARKAQ